MRLEDLRLIPSVVRAYAWRLPGLLTLDLIERATLVVLPLPPSVAGAAQNHARHPTWRVERVVLCKHKCAIIFYQRSSLRRRFRRRRTMSGAGEIVFGEGQQARPLGTDRFRPSKIRASGAERGKSGLATNSEQKVETKCGGAGFTGT